MTVRQRHRQGFTLIEMLIVGALIVLFAGLAMIGAQRMYDDNRKKAMLDETKSIGSALSFARQDVGFYPRIHALALSRPMVYFPSQQPGGRDFCLPALDTYGYYGTGDNQATGVALLSPPMYAMDKNWRGPYMTVSQARALNSSGRRSGLIKMRLMDTAYAGLAGRNPLIGDEPTLVDWPTDTWGNPYVFYQVKVSAEAVAPGSNPKGLRLVSNPTDDGDYFVAVVSYGPNRVPGGNEQFPETGFGEAEMLYVKGDLAGTVADYTLKSVTAQGPARLDTTNAAWVARFAQSISSSMTGKVGITDNGSDDVFFKL